MNNFRNQGRSFDRGRSGDRGRSNDRGRGGASDMHEATCGECGKKCQVPFRPTGQKPVYCSECFENHRDSRGTDRPNRGGFQERSTVAKCDCREQLEKIISKMDAIITLITPAPAPEKPVKAKKKAASLKEVVKTATKKKAPAKKKK